MNDVFDTIRPLNQGDIDTGDTAFWDLSRQEQDSLFAEWHAFFKSDHNFNVDIIREYRHSYWQWYVRLGWDSLARVPHNDWARFIMYTLPDAIQLGMHPIDKFNTSFTYDVYAKERKIIWQGLREILQNDEFTFHFPFTYRTLSTRYIRVDQQGDTMQQAELVNEVSGYLCTIDDPNVRISKEEITREASYLLDFLRVVLRITTPELYVQAVYNVMHASIEDDDLADMANQLYKDTETMKVVFGDRFAAAAPHLFGIHEEDIDIHIPENEVEEAEPTLTSTLSYTDMQSHILSTYGNISEKSAEEMSPIFEYLEEQATAQGDDAIHTLIVFDAATQQFVWNDELLV